jgi:S1-C subfamily serine protease
MPKWMSLVRCRTMLWLVFRVLGSVLATFSAPLCAAAADTSPDVSPDIEVQARALARANASVVGVRAVAVEDARSSDNLGREREGSGVIIDANGLVVTIGYLIMEAEHVDLVIDRDRVVPARVVAYDLASGFGLLQALAPLRAPPANLGSSQALSSDEPLMIASGGEAGDISIARMVSRRSFSGFWEYHIDGALFTSPPRTDHSGAALFNARGELMGIGSLIVLDAMGSGHPRMPGNMFVPVDILRSILPELRQRGATRSSTRAWLGINCVENDGMVRVVRITRESPAEEAGLQPGDKILRIDGAPVKNLEGFYKSLWDGTPAEREVTLTVGRGEGEQTVKVQAKDRMKTLRRARGI